MVWLGGQRSWLRASICGRAGGRTVLHTVQHTHLMYCLQNDTKTAWTPQSFYFLRPNNYWLVYLPIVLELFQALISTVVLNTLHLGPEKTPHFIVTMGLKRKRRLHNKPLHGSVQRAASLTNGKLQTKPQNPLLPSHEKHSEGELLTCLKWVICGIV